MTIPNQDPNAVPDPNQGQQQEKERVVVKAPEAVDPRVQAARDDLYKRANKAMDKAKIKLMGRPSTAFFTSLVFSCNHNWDENIPIQRSSGTNIRYNPTMFASSTPELREYLLVHPTMHLALLHPVRRGGKFWEEWNDACDHVVNLLMKERGFFIPDWALCDEKYAGQKAEDVYGDLLMNKPPMPKNRPDYRDMEDDSSAPNMNRDMERDIQEIVTRAHIRSKQDGDAAGTIPGDVEIMLEELLDPKLPWERVLANHVHESLGKATYTMRKPNRRYIGQGFWLPSLQGHRLKNFTAYIDISSSVSDEDFQQQVSEIGSIFRMLRPQKITLVTFNSQITGVHECRSLQELRNIVFNGRGGTKIGPVLDHMNETKPDLALVLSDGEFRWPEQTTKVPVVWVVYDRPQFEAPFGRVVHYQIHHKKAA